MLGKKARDSSDKESTDDEDLALLAKRFRKVFADSERVAIGDPPNQVKNSIVTLMRVPKCLRIRKKRVLKTSDVMSVLDLNMLGMIVLTIKGIKSRP